MSRCGIPPSQKCAFEGNMFGPVAAGGAALIPNAPPGKVEQQPGDNDATNSSDSGAPNDCIGAIRRADGGCNAPLAPAGQ